MNPHATPSDPTTRIPWRGGWAAMPHSATRSALPNNAYRVLGLLIGLMDLTTCEVHGQSAQRLATALDWSQRTVERALATLRATGWVSTYPDSAPYRLGWLVYVVRQEEMGVAPSSVSEEVRQNGRTPSDSGDEGVPTRLSVHDQESDSDSDQEDSPTPVAAVPAPSDLSESFRQLRRTRSDTTDGPPPPVSSDAVNGIASPVAALAGDAPPNVTATEQLLLEAGFHPNTAHTFRDFAVEAVRGELHTHDLLGWLPREDRDRRIGMLVLRWRRVEPGARREPETGSRSPESRATQERAAPPPSSDPDHDPSIDDDRPCDPWIAQARHLRPQWANNQLETLARALRHAPNARAAVVMAQVALGVALRCGERR